MSAFEWRPRERDYQEEKEQQRCEEERVENHPLVPDEVQTVGTLSLWEEEPEEEEEEEKKKEEEEEEEPMDDPLGVTKSASFVDPLGIAGGSSDPLGISGTSTPPPLGGREEVSYETAKSRRRNQRPKQEGEQELLEEGFVPWSNKKAAVLQRYTTDEAVAIHVSFMPEHKQIQVNMDSTERRLKELEQQDNEEDRLLQVSQQEYISHIESLDDALRTAWDVDQNRVRALKIAIRCAKVLGDTSVIKFYPSKFVMISEILDSFGRLVFDRIRFRTADDGSAPGDPLPDDFVAEDVSDLARQTCLNWLHKVASIRELLPRLYIEMALLPCYRYVYNDPFELLLERLTMQLRGVCDPLVATYARSYLARVAMRVRPRLKDYLLTGFCDHLHIMKQNIDTGVVERIAKHNNITQIQYYDLYSPALDWLLQCLAHENHDTDTLRKVLEAYSQNRDALTLNHIMANWSPEVVARMSVEFTALTRDADDTGFSRNSLWSTFGVRLILSPPPDEVKAPLWAEVWDCLLKEEDLATFVNLCEVWTEYPVKYLSTGVVDSFVGAILERVGKDNLHESVQDQLQSIVQKILLNYPDYTHVERISRFHSLVDLFDSEHQVQVQKAVLRSFRRFPGESINDPVVIEHLFTAAKIVHDSINMLSFADEKRQVAALLCFFASKVDFGEKAVEKQLHFLSDARRAFGHFDEVKETLINSVCAVAMRTLRLVGGKHTARTAPFIRACMAFCYISIPSMEDVFTRLNLYTYCGQVALQNGAISQAEALFKEAIQLLRDMPAQPEDIEREVVKNKCRETEAKLIAFVRTFASTMIVIPGHPEIGPFYLLNGLLAVLGKFSWLPGSLEPVRAYSALLSALAALAQPDLIYHVPHVESNDTLYGGDDMYLKELYKLVDSLVDSVLARISGMAKDFPEESARASAEFFDLTVSLCELTPKTGNLCAKLLEQGRKAKAAEYVKRAFEALVYRDSPVHNKLRVALAKSLV